MGPCTPPACSPDLYGHIQDELQEQVNDPDETDDLLRLGLHRLPITQFPRLRSLATVLATYDGAAEPDEGLAIVIAGLRSQLLTSPPHSQPARAAETKRHERAAARPPIVAVLRSPIPAHPPRRHTAAGRICTSTSSARRPTVDDQPEATASDGSMPVRDRRVDDRERAAP
jgi:hypothetical protein